MTRSSYDTYINFYLLCRAYLRQNGITQVNQGDIGLSNNGTDYNIIITNWNFSVSQPTIDDLNNITDTQLAQEQQYELIPLCSIKQININQTLNYNSYKKISSFVLKYGNSVVYAEVCIVPSINNRTFSMRLYDIINKQVVCENTLLSYQTYIQGLGLILYSGQTADTVIEVQINNGINLISVNVDNINIYYQ